MVRVEDIVKHEDKWYILGADLELASTVFFRRLVLPVAFAAITSFSLLNATTYQIYKTLVENNERLCGEESALAYAKNSIKELGGPVSPAARPFYFGAEYYLHKYVSTHQKK